MAINALQVAWLSRLVRKGVIRAGDSMIEFSPQDVLCSRRAVEFYALRHQPPATVARSIEEIFDGPTPRPTGIPAFYRLFGIDRYRSTDLIDGRADWSHDFNHRVALPQRFRVATNFGTAEHIFNIGAMFRSMHDALLPGGVALYVLPAFGDIDHGFYNVHPTTYFDLAQANGYVVDDFHYVDRWDVRNRVLESEVAADIDFDALPIRTEQVLDRALLQRLVTETFVANYQREDTQRYGVNYPAVLYDYCACALRKANDTAFRMPIQRYYGGGATAAAAGFLNTLMASPLGARLLRRSVRAIRSPVRALLNPIRARLKLRTRLKYFIGRS
jgi:hypothetical protein